VLIRGKAPEEQSNRSHDNNVARGGAAQAFENFALPLTS
jgi:hypothetical protein